MPYSSIDDLPANTKSLPKHAKEIFLAAFNSAIEQGNSEESAFKIAWSAVGKSYEKVDGEWKKAGNLISSPELINKEHDVILERLNQTIHYKDHGDIFYSEQPFLDSINKWDGIPIIFANEHPDFKSFDDDPNKELTNIKGSIVGRVTFPKVELTGTSRVEAKFSIDNPIIENLIKDGKIAHSPGFKFKADSKNHLTSVLPHHVLIFIQDIKNQPRDKGAMILNKEDEIENAEKKPYGDVDYADPGYQEDGVYRYPIDTEKHVRAAWSYINMPKNQKAYSADQLAKIKAKIESAAKKFGITIANMETDMANKDYTKDDMKSMLKDLQSHPEMMDDEMKSMMKGMKNKEQETKDTMGKEDELTKQLEISNKEKETLTGELKGTKESLEIANKQLKVFEQKETERKKVETETRWQTIKNKIPKGLTHKPEDETTLRKQFEEQPQEFAVRMTEFMNKPELPGEEGKAITNSGTDLDSPGPGAKIGEYDAHTGAWK